MGCEKKIQIIDIAGLPIRDADVTAASLSMNGNAIKSQADGYVYVPENISIQDVRWITIKAVGYKQRRVDVSLAFPGKIVLEKE